ncbi:MAG: class I SAM-dependent methyltransferase [Gemmatimonadota bacterium]
MAAGEWWKTAFDRHYLTEYEPLFSPARDRREVARLTTLLGLPVGATLLDCPCGQGRHAHLLAEHGYDVVGLDYSSHLLAHARRRGTARNLRYQRGDMRSLPAGWTGRFDAVVNTFTSFGFFVEPRDDARVIEEFARVMAPGGTLIWHGGNRDGIVRRFVTRDWWETDDGALVTQERLFDPLSGVMETATIIRSPGQREVRRQYRIRLYTPTRLAELCQAAGLIVEEAYDSWSSRPLGRASTEMLLVVRKH